MSAAELMELRNETKEYIDHADERVLKLVRAMLKADAEDDSEVYTLTPEQEAELDRRMDLEKQGLMKYSSWEEAKARILSK